MPSGTNLAPRDNTPFRVNMAIRQLTQGHANTTGTITERTPIGDASYDVLATDGMVVTSATFTGARTWTLPLLSDASNLYAGQILYLVDEVSAVSAAHTLTVAVQSGQKLNGVTNGTFVIGSAGFALALEFDGLSNWTFCGQNTFANATFSNATFSDLTVNGTATISTAVITNATISMAAITSVTVAGNAVLTVAGNQTVSGGFSESPFSNGTFTNGSVTPSPLKNLKQTIINNGAFTINAPTTVGDIELYVTNGASAGNITFANFTKQWAGDSLDTTSGHEFVAFIYTFTNDAGSVRTSYLIKAMQ